MGHWSLARFACLEAPDVAPKRALSAYGKVCKDCCGAGYSFVNFGLLGGLGNPVEGRVRQGVPLRRGTSANARRCVIPRKNALLLSGETQGGTIGQLIGEMPSPSI
jgi:hypothetical protein